MPIYEYHCKACDHEFELEQRITEDPVKKCPACGKHKVRRLISNTSFMLKGSGWYSDGYHGGKSKPGKTDTTSTTAKSDKTSASTKDTPASSSKKSSNGNSD